MIIYKDFLNELESELMNAFSSGKDRKHIEQILDETLRHKLHVCEYADFIIMKAKEKLKNQTN